MVFHSLIWFTRAEISGMYVEPKNQATVEAAQA